MKRKNLSKAIESTLFQLDRALFYDSEFDTYKTKSRTLIGVCKELLNNSHSEEQEKFIKTFNRIIRDTNKYFVPLPRYLGRYYGKIFVNEIKEKYNKGMRGTTGKLRTYSDSLFKAYVKAIIFKRNDF